ncbi:uncharacterized protein LOC120915124 [Rana temporaria]|uniref:uncharacterized protein LOC120915124 n=1 Tax=Rana temporaria TaxID=8407 RepID=UPI001AADD6BB|nr:uncharacterized protein LOC120915124 [Rana temporaria]
MLIPSCETVNATTNSKQALDVTFNVSELYARISEMLERGLAQTAERITGEIRADFQNLGSRIETIEHNLDVNVARTTQNADHLQYMQDQLELAQARIDELENRSRRGNFRIRGLPESVLDIDSAVQDIIKMLLPHIPAHKLDLDRAHRSLGPIRKDGLPRDIVIKPHYFSTKEEIMKCSRQREQLTYQGANIQIFSDISPYTIQKRRSMKPLLSALLQKEIRYKWAFPFALKFSYKGNHYAVHNFQEGERLLMSLNIISTVPDMDTSPIQQGSTKRQTPISPTSSTWTKVKYRKVKDDSVT